MDEVARELAADGVEVIMHFSLKDVNRGMVESRAYSLMRQGIRNLLVLSGITRPPAHSASPSPCSTWTPSARSRS